MPAVNIAVTALLKVSLPSIRKKCSPLATDSAVADAADAFRYDPQGDQWHALAPLPSARRGPAAVAIDDRYILLLGGCRNEKDVPIMLDEVLAYDVKEDRYHACKPLPYAAVCQAAVMREGEVFVLGGEDAPRHRTDRVVVGRLTKTAK